MSKVTETVTELTKEVIEKEGFELFDLEFVKEGKNNKEKIGFYVFT